MLKYQSGLVGLCLLAATSLAVSLPEGSARADDLRPLLERIDRLERDLNQLQRQVYRNQVGTAPTPAAGVDGSASLDSQIRMDQLDAQLRTLTGQLEEIQYNIAQLTSRLEKTQADNEVRFQQLEHGGGPPPVPAETAQARTASGPVGAPQRLGPPAGDSDRPPLPAGVQAVPSPGAASPPAPPGAPPPQTPLPAGGALPEGSTTEQYNYAFGLLRDSDFKGAEAAFRGFVQKHPGDQLAGNAQYWLGETYFVRGDYPAAASAFAEGYQKYPQGSKAPDNLLKLGMSLGNSGRKNDACFAFAKLERDFPQMPPIIKDREVSEKKRLGC
jgi:tol-pal system protein YbgF